MDPIIKQVLRTIPTKCRARSTAKGILIFLLAAGFYVGSLLSTALCSDLYLFCAVPLNSLAVGILFIVGHDACHGSFLPSKQLNRWIATIAFLPSMHPFSSWAKTHNMMHHTWTNLKGKDPVYGPFSLDEYRSLPLLRRKLEQFYRSFFGLSFFYAVEIWWKLEIKPDVNTAPSSRSNFLMDRLFVVSYFILEILVLSAVAGMAGKSTSLQLPFLVLMTRFSIFCWMIAIITYLHHTHPEIQWFDREDEWNFFQCQVAGTTHIQLPRIVEIILLNILDHTAHHVDPLIPLYNLRASQAALESNYPNSMKVIRWTPKVFFQTLRCCKLYDYRQHRWLDFKGRPTGPVLLKEYPMKASANSDCAEFSGELRG